MRAFTTVLLFSLQMVALPAAAFLAAFHGRLDPLLVPLLGQQVVQNNRAVVAGVLAVLAVNVTIAAFVAAAWAEPPLPPKTTKCE